MRTTRASLEADIIREARAFRDSCDDGLGLVANTGAYQAWLALSRTLDRYDAIDPTDIRSRSHTANADGPDTEHLAAEMAVPRQHSVRHRMLMAYRVRASLDFGEGDGITDSEMEYVLKKPHTTVSSARNWLAAGGWIADSGLRRATPAKCPAIVWALTPAGLRALDVAAAA